jgi:hypothetical protein
LKVNVTEEIIATVEGPNGTAQVIEVPTNGGKSLEYQARFKGTSETFKSMGEAYITAKEKAGVKN